MGEAGFARYTLEEIRQQYGESTPRRQFLFRRLQTVTRLLSETGSLRHLYLFGSFTTAKPTPGDLDCLAVMSAGFTTMHLPAPLQANQVLPWIPQTEAFIADMRALLSRDD